jgi:hypothetical protein
LAIGGEAGGRAHERAAHVEDLPLVDAGATACTTAVGARLALPRQWQWRRQHSGRVLHSRVSVDYSGSIARGVAGSTARRRRGEQLTRSRAVARLLVREHDGRHVVALVLVIAVPRPDAARGQLATDATAT